ncbi:retrotransposon protein, putative, ty1-copia subclass [Tanacetum coccineum]
MVNVFPPDHVDDLSEVEPNQPDLALAIPEPALVDENEEPDEEEEFKEEEEFEEEEPQEEEEDMEVDIEEEENEPELIFPYEEADPLNPPPPASDSSPKILQSVKSYLGKCFAIKDLGEATFILGIKIYRDRLKRLIGLSQSAYMDTILKKLRMDTSKRGYIPMQDKLDLNKTQGASSLEEVNHMFLVYGGNPKAELRVDCYCDAGFKTDRDDIKSQTRYVFVLNGGAVDWKSSKQSTTTMCATEAKYIAASEAAMEAI